MKPRPMTLAILAVLLLSAPAIYAVPISFFAVLSGAAEVTPNSLPGTGTALITWDDVAHTLQVDATFGGLLAPNTAAHIHCCTMVPLTGGAGVATQTPTFTGFPSGTSGHLLPRLRLDGHGQLQRPLRHSERRDGGRGRGGAPRRNAGEEELLQHSRPAVCRRRDPRVPRAGARADVAAAARLRPRPWRGCGGCTAGARSNGKRGGRVSEPGRGRLVEERASRPGGGAGSRPGRPS